jgi:hypothetical protein
VANQAAEFGKHLTVYNEQRNRGDARLMSAPGLKMDTQKTDTQKKVVIRLI